MFGHKKIFIQQKDFLKLEKKILEFDKCCNKR